MSSTSHACNKPCPRSWVINKVFFSDSCTGATATLATTGNTDWSGFLSAQQLMVHGQRPVNTGMWDTQAQIPLTSLELRLNSVYFTGEMKLKSLTTSISSLLLGFVQGKNYLELIPGLWRESMAVYT